MGQAMSWGKNSVIDEAQGLARKAVRLHRQRGVKGDEAIECAALALGTTPRRVKGLLYSEVFHVARDEYRRLLSRWWASIDRETADVHDMLIKMRNEAEAQWADEHQLSLDLPAPSGAPSRRGSVSGVRGPQR